MHSRGEGGGGGQGDFRRKQMERSLRHNATYTSKPEEVREETQVLLLLCLKLPGIKYFTLSHTQIQTRSAFQLSVCVINTASLRNWSTGCFVFLSFKCKYQLCFITNMTNLNKFKCISKGRPVAADFLSVYQ